MIMIEALPKIVYFQLASSKSLAADEDALQVEGAPGQLVRLQDGQLLQTLRTSAEKMEIMNQSWTWMYTLPDSFID